MREKSDTSDKKDSDDSSNDTSVSCLQTSEIWYKAYYFLFYGAIGSSVPFLALYFKQLGLSAAQAGLLNGIRLFSEFIGAPVWGMIGDKYKIRKIILFLSLLSYSAGYTRHDLRTGFLRKLSCKRLTGLTSFQVIN